MDTILYKPPERRRHPRTRLTMMLHGIRLDPDGGDVCDTLRMVDISRSGLGALSDTRMPPGQRVIVCLPLHPDGGRRNLYATVVRCHRQEKGYHVGMQFDHMGLGEMADIQAQAA